MSKAILHRNEKEIIRVLIKEARSLTPNEIADYTGMSWLTAKKYLIECEKKSLVAKDINDKRERFIVEPKLLQALFKRRSGVSNDE